MFENLLGRISRQLRLAKIPYMVIGGQAVLLYGEPRLTKDIDITLGVGIEAFEKIKSMVSQLGLTVLSEDPEKFVRETMVLPLADPRSGIRIDLIFSSFPYERQALKRARRVKLGNSSICFASLEDVVIHKIIAGRPRDLEDIKGMLMRNPACDRKYVAKWLKEFDQALGRNFLRLFERITKGLGQTKRIRGKGKR